MLQLYTVSPRFTTVSTSMFQGYERTLNAVLWAHLFSSFASYMT